MAGKRAATTKSETPVAARQELDELTSSGTADQTAGLKEQAKEQEAEQRDLLKSGRVTSGPARQQHDAHQKLLKKDDVAGIRAGRPGVLVQQGGQIDNMTRASDADALEGHFCKIDLSALDKDQREYLDGRDYGVYLSAGMLDQETGRPILAVVRLRDETHETVTVPYAALSPATAGGRR